MIFLRKILDRLGFNWFFLLLVVVLYILLLAVFSDWGIETFWQFLKVLMGIVPVLLFVYFFIFVFNLIISNAKIQEKLKTSSNIFKYLISVFGGILSTGPVYLWYPFLKQLRGYGLNNGHITSFVYARAIKIPMFPLMIWYFGLLYTVVFNVVLLIFAFIIGPSINLFFKLFPDENNNSVS